jgi:hypothetical protein
VSARRLALATLGCCGLALAAWAGPSAGLSSAACKPRSRHIEGRRVRTLCGPASATVRVSGRTTARIAGKRSRGAFTGRVFGLGRGSGSFSCT